MGTLKQRCLNENIIAWQLLQTEKKKKRLPAQPKSSKHFFIFFDTAN